jgi:2-polyprenyl-3-methyl-5-hydroxy-6-metoxy-1,4-benzoquinol methylase
MPETPRIKDKAGEAYWSSTWEKSALPPAIDPYDRVRGNFVVRHFHSLFSELFFASDARGANLLEIGCARSVWLPYFAKQFGFKVSGIDYSEVGCQQAGATLQREGVTGKIICADFYSPPSSFVEQFDIVVSFGVAEHFTDTSQCIAAFAKFLKPGGRMITIIPNMTWIVGLLQRVLDKSVYDVHVPLNAIALRRANEHSQLDVLSCKYFMSTNFGVLNTSRLTGLNLSSRLKQRIAVNLSRASTFIGIFEDRAFRWPATRLVAPYIVCVSRKKTTG